MADEKPPPVPQVPPPGQDDQFVLKIDGLRETIETLLKIESQEEKVERLIAMVTETITALAKDVGRLTLEAQELKNYGRVCIGLLHVTMRQARIESMNIMLDAVNAIHEEETLSVEFRPEWKKWRVQRQARPGKIVAPPPGFKVRGNNT